ncbi:glycolate oxidase FAD binding subunit [Nitrosomonas aestuarii]|uniref:Glycolate oxidase FAD binding subunit n=1 Tax=Nitrosomonas aestuarii TaxID=52441 RepID=A0A1I3X2F1_9PROT|nr:glycolate oxidase subunit GlcE [Nitrosomonas aestuarii]SFK13972.1 glycolate oxidase FAD binding subunit [Nitrosomonas aestuarii]
MQTVVDQLSSKIRDAAKGGQPLAIQGSDSKAFYGRRLSERVKTLHVAGYQGIVDYEPTELVITARAGTPLKEIESLLHQNGQMLAFEPPYFADTATLGGCIAAGLSGPRRASAGAVRDFVLGVRMLDGIGQDLHFGGQVMKNVAGYDVSRLMVGAMGTLGVLLEVSLKVLPLPVGERTLSLEMDEASAITFMNRCATKPLPISATCYVDNQLFIRLSGAESAVQVAYTQIGGEDYIDSYSFWKSVREQTHDFFQPETSLWRLSINSTTLPLKFPFLPGKQLIEWNGALRWLACSGDDRKTAADSIRQAANMAGGHATLFRGNQSNQIFQPLGTALLSIHQRLKQKFDPAGIFNPGRLYPEL